MELQTSKRILVVEDEPGIRDLLREVFTLEGYTVSVAEHGEMALNLLLDADNRFDLMITDVVMPVLDGLSLVRQVHNRQLSEDMPIIVMTGTHSEEASGLQEQGLIRQVVTKPFRVFDMPKLVEKIIAK